MNLRNNRFAALVNDNNNNNNNNNNNHKFRDRKNRNQRNNKVSNDNRVNKFKSQDNKPKKELSIDLGENSFPVLLKCVEDKDISKNPIKEMSYIEKIKYFKELNEKKDLLPKGWVRLTKNNKLKKFEKNNFEKNPYYNPDITYMIIYERYTNREELNNLIGDISPYWFMDEEYEYDTRELEETNDINESNDSDYSDNDEYNDYL